MVILRSRNKITYILMILAWASPFKLTSATTGIGNNTFLVQIFFFKVTCVPDVMILEPGRLYWNDCYLVT